MQKPLRERIDVDPTHRLPAGPGPVRWRRATPEDAEQLAELAGAIAAADHPEWAETAEELAEELAHSWMDLDADSVIGDVEGELVAYGLQVAPPDPETVVRSIAMGGVRPSARGTGIGRELLDWHRLRARQQLASSELALPGWHMLYVEEANASGIALATRAGLPLVRWFTNMTRDLADEIPDVPLPEGLRLATPTQDDVGRIRDARNEAFRDHWGSQPSSEEGWASFTGSSVLRLDLSAIALDGDRVAGLVLSQVNPADFALQGYEGGYLPLVGVVRDWRRRGVAPALLAEVMRRHRAEGYVQVGLDVDSESPTGALGLYTGMGFRAVSRSLAFVEEL
ncbi:GNAT family N-acetyltransferase [Salinibacterium sp. ZJ70]|uniref:GNAT family N-acetyltransferase n=1 Tax=Salinibacterium sp. ZJ70 TaxID=2708084 RepID=UPI00141E3A8F|nr:GNAT family N-acetyltransferase [Salinibacterium sp. ZJ70]